MQKNAPAENKMGVMPIPKLILNMSLPMILSMLVQALYNVVDSYFVARFEQDALTAVSLYFPVQVLLVAFSLGTGIGINALIFDTVHPIYRAHGFRWAETNAELEDNQRIRSIWQEFDTEPNKRRRIYGKDL